MSQRKGFTLVELLVVIAIIALLMPALALKPYAGCLCGFLDGSEDRS